MVCCFWPEIIIRNQDGTIGKIYPVKPLKLNNLLKKNHICVWYQDEISLADNRLLRPFKTFTTGRNKIKYPNMVEDNHWKALKKRSKEEGNQRLRY